MAFDTATLTKARESGYSDEEISGFLVQSDPRAKTAFESGYTIDEVASHFDPKPTGPRPEGELSSRFLSSAAEGGLNALTMAARVGSSLNPLTKVGDFLAEKTGIGLTSTEVVQELEGAAQRSRDDYGVDPKFDKGLLSAVASGAGSLVPILASGGTLAPVTGAAMAGEQGLQEAEEAGATGLEKVVTATGNAGLAFASEKLLGLPALLKSVKAAKMPTDTFKGLVKSVMAQVGKSFFREGTQETLEQVGSDIIAKHIAAYDPERQIFDPDKLGTTFLAGGLVGGGLGGVTQLAQDVAPKEQMQEMAENIDQSIAQTLQAEPPPITEVPPTVSQTPQGTPVLSPEEIQAVPEAQPGEVPLETALTPDDYVPALKVGDEVVRGKKGETHQDIMKRYIAENEGDEAKVEAATTAFLEDETHIFEAPDRTPLTRTELQEALGEDRPVQSERLRELQTKPPTADQVANELQQYRSQAIAAAKASGATDPELAASIAQTELSKQVASGQTRLSDPKSLFISAAENQASKQVRGEQAQKRGGGKVVSGDVEGKTGATVIEEAKTDVGPRAEMVAKETAQSIQDVVNSMPENDQKVMRAFMEDASLTIDEISEQTGLTVDQVKKAKSRATKALAQFVKDQGMGERMAPGASNIRELRNARYTLASDIYEGLRQSGKLTRETFEKNVESQYPELFTKEDFDDLWTVSQMASEKFRESFGRKPMNKVIDQITGGKEREGQTSRKNKEADRQRRERGLPAAMEAARRSHVSVWDEAMRAMDYDPQLQSDTIAKFRDSSEVPTDLENAILLHATIEAENKFDDAVDRVNEAKNEQEQITAFEESRQAERELIELYDINKSTGTSAGRALAARRMMSDRNYTLQRMLAETRASKGGVELTAEEQSQVKKNFEEINKSKTELEEQTAKKDEQVATQQAQDALDTMTKDVEPAVKSLLDRILERLRKPAEAARERLLARLQRTSSLLDPTILYDVSVVGAYQIAKGIKKLSDWKKAMSSELNGEFEEYYDEAFREASRRVDEAVDETTKTSPKKEKVKKLLKDASLDEVLEDTKKKIRNRISEGESLQDLRSYIQKMALTLVRSGTTQLDPLLDTLHSIVEPMQPGITRREIMDLFSGYGDAKQLDPESAKVTMRDLKGQSQQLAKIEDIPKGIPLRKTGVERRTPSDTERRLIKQVNELARVFGIKVTDPATQLRSILGAIKTRLQNDIRDLTHQIETGEKPIPRTPAPTDSEIEGLRAKKKELQEIIAELNKGKVDPEALNRAIKAYKSQLQRRMADLQSMIAKNDFEIKKKRVLDISKDAEAVKLRAQFEVAKREFENRKMENERATEGKLRKALRIAKEGLNIPRAVKSSFDLSAVLRQGGFITFGNPARSIGAIRDMLRSFTQKGFEKVDAELRLRKNYSEYKNAKLYLADLDGALDRREEAFRSELADKIPGVKLSNRTYIAFLNRLRADSYDAMIGSLPTTPTQEQKKAIAHFINVATGRGDLGVHGSAAETLSTVFWSPRLLISRIQLLAGEPLMRGDAKGVRSVIAKEYAKTLVGATVVLALGALAGADIEEDPRSSDFGKLKFGETRIDPWFGLQQITTLGARTGMTGLESMGFDTPGMKTQQDKVYSLRAKEGEKRSPFQSTYTDVALRFAETKFTPLLGGFLHHMSNEDVVGKVGSPLKFKDTFPFVPEIISPLSFDELVPVMEEQGIPRGTAMQILNLFGMSVQHQEQRGGR